jgi:transcriptional regulator with XRE-family HTH domain
MAERLRKPRHDLYAEYRERSGWYLAAWRDHARLTLEELAAELESSKGYVSDLETGASRPGRSPPRFNRDLVEKLSKIFGTTGGRLIDVNPFLMWEGAGSLEETIQRLGDEDRRRVLDMAQALASKDKAA